MTLLRLESGPAGLFLPELNLWLDPREPRLGPERVFVSHAHSDHVAAHREVILSAATSSLMQARLPGERLEHVLQFRQTSTFHGASGSFQVTLFPAGHIFGSAMSLITAGRERLLYTGDFKLRPGLSAEPCEPVPADILVMESTFGRPAYVFPPTDLVLQGVLRFCREALDNDETPVLLGYSLGKSQELLCCLGGAGLPLMLHGTVFRLTRIYEQFGQCFPPYERYEAGAARGKVLLCPPHVVNSAMLRNLGRTRTAILTGWAVDPNCRYRYQCDAAFPLSDHADFPQLLELVNRVQPKRVYTVHGFAAEFAQTLRAQGYAAQPLGQEEQLGLALSQAAVPGPVQVHGSSDVAAEPLQAPSDSGAVKRSDSFREFAETCARIGADPRKLEKVRVLADYLQTLEGASLLLATTWFTGRAFPAADNKVMHLGWAVLRDALCAVAKVDAALFHQVYLKHSDLGETAAELLRARAGSGTLTLECIGRLFEELQAVRGPLAKTPLLRDILAACSGLEARYLVKIITGDLRIGLKEGLLEEAVASAFGRTAADVRKANLLLGNIGETALLAASDKLAEASLVPFRPVKFMLATPEETSRQIWEHLGAVAGLVWLEDKYDGVRCQAHKSGQRVALYSRDLKDITATFRELADALSRMEQDFVLDGEIVAMRGEQVLPFADLQRRLGRREGDLFMREEVPIKLVAFDLLWTQGETLLDCTLAQRRHRLEALGPRPDTLRLAQITEARSADEIETAFEAARARGNEGLMIKDPASVYAPGRRGQAWLKLKKALATLDCVVIGAEYGHGKRGQVLSDYTFAVRDEASGQLKTIGKAYTGLTDAEIASLTEHFLNTATRQQGRYFEVPPDTILEIAFDRIQPSSRHSSGLALRFPRIVRVRTDKSAADIDSLETAQRLAEKLASHGRGGSE